MRAPSAGPRRWSQKDSVILSEVGLDDAGVIPNLSGQSVGYFRAVFQHDQFLAHLHYQPHVMFDEHDGNAAIPDGSDQPDQNGGSG